ncbi:MAG: hypothetical protein P8N74_04685 [Polaribacter sp.]|nr:hypothetical protein [Polaribacter sp.]
MIKSIENCNANFPTFALLEIGTMISTFILAPKVVKDVKRRIQKLEDTQ